MKTTLTTSDNKILVSNATPEQANVALKSIHRRNRHSDIYYHIQFNNGQHVTGSIDMEPRSFHQPHKDTILTTHILTYWGNVAKADLKKYPWLDEDSKKFALQTYINILIES